MDYKFKEENTMTTINLPGEMQSSLRVSSTPQTTKQEGASGLVSTMETPEGIISRSSFGRVVLEAMSAFFVSAVHADDFEDEKTAIFAKFGITWTPNNDGVDNKFAYLLMALADEKPELVDAVRQSIEDRCGNGMNLGNVKYQAFGGWETIRDMRSFQDILSALNIDETNAAEAVRPLTDDAGKVKLLAKYGITWPGNHSDNVDNHFIRLLNQLDQKISPEIAKKVRQKIAVKCGNGTNLGNVKHQAFGGWENIRDMRSYKDILSALEIRE